MKKEYQKIEYNDIQVGDHIRIELGIPSPHWPGRPERLHGMVSILRPFHLGLMVNLTGYGKHIIFHNKLDVIGVERFQN